MKKATLIILFFSLLLIPDFAQACQGDFFDQIGFDDNVRDVPESPINGLVFLGMAVASFLGYRKLKK